jgi:hypothetical protein
LDKQDGSLKASEELQKAFVLKVEADANQVTFQPPEAEQHSLAKLIRNLQITGTFVFRELKVGPLTDPVSWPL